MRYQMVLKECEATRPENWGTMIHEGESILALWDSAGWAGQCIDWNQEIEVVDTKTSKRMSRSEYKEIVMRLKGW